MCLIANVMQQRNVLRPCTQGLPVPAEAQVEQLRDRSGRLESQIKVLKTTEFSTWLH